MRFGGVLGYRVQAFFEVQGSSVWCFRVFVCRIWGRGFAGEVFGGRGSTVQGLTLEARWSSALNANKPYKPANPYNPKPQTLNPTP